VPRNRLQDVRERRGLSLRGLSWDTGLDYSYLSKVERGLEPMRDANKLILARYYGLTVGYLFHGGNEDDTEDTGG
jgi:transcriptional regulator with XRE-family HTH domain